MQTRFTFVLACLLIIVAVNTTPSLNTLPPQERVTLAWQGLTALSAMFGAEALINIATHLSNRK